MKWNTALVTGGAGFIGSHVDDELINRGTEVVSIDNYLSGSRANNEHLLEHVFFHGRETDVCDYPALEELFKYKWMNGPIEAIFHQAASKKTICLADPRRDLDINAKGTFNLLELARKYDVKKFVHASTGSVYGEGYVFPQTEEHPLMPTSYYGVSKLAGEKYVRAFGHLYGMDTTVLRYFHVYGGRQNWTDTGGVVPIFIRRMLNKEPVTIFGDGGQQRSFTYVQDVVNANMMVCDRPDSKGQAYNCASGINVTIKELATRIASMLKIEPNIQYKDWAVGDIKVFQIDNTKIKRLGFEFKTSFDAGLRNTVRWMINAKAQGRF
jgi:UDP-glucose 4-epimerase